MFIKIIFIALSLVLISSCGGNVGSGRSASSSGTTSVTQFSLLPDEQFSRSCCYNSNHQACLMETVSGQTIYYTELFFKSSVSGGAMTDSLDRVKFVYSDNACTNELYSIAFLRNLVSTTQSNSASSTDNSIFSLVDVQINVSDASIVTAYNQNSYLGKTDWQLNTLTYVIDLLDPSTNTVIYQSGTTTTYQLRADVQNKNIYIDGIKYLWP